jgi:dTDP-4-amino-4,6-dideoxygalactose transaminase
MKTDLEIDVKEIGWVDLKSQYLAKRNEILALVDQVFTNGEFVNGKSVDLLEAEIARYVGVKYALCLNSGTDALIFAMKALGIGPGDEVITPPNSFIASTSSIVHVGAKPVFVDVCEDQLIDPSLIEKAVTPNTKAIMVVHLAGRTAEMGEINRIAIKHNLYVIEDAAQAFGAKYNNVRAGALADVGCFSAHPLKIFNAAGDAGFLTTDREEVYNEVRLLRNHGLMDRTTAVKWGYVSRMNSLQAELLRMRLAQEIDSNIAKRRINASIYRKVLNPKYIFMPEVPDHLFHTYMCLVIQVPRRDDLQRYLADHGVRVAVHYPIPIHLQPAAKDLGYKKGDFPMTEKQADSIMTIPVHQFMEEEDVLHVAELINGFYD